MNLRPITKSKTNGFMRMKRRRTTQSGQSAVEMALTLPLLLLILAGVIITAFIFYAFLQVTNAAREGARAGSVYRLTMNDGTNLSLDQAVRKAIYDDRGTATTSDDVSALGSLSPVAPSFDVAGTDVVCTLNGSPCSGFDQSNPPNLGDQLSVQVTYRYTVPVVSAALPMFPQPIVLVRTVVMEVQ